MITNDIVGVGESANYSCWPGYTHVSGNLTRTCLPTLVLSGRRPTCEQTCTSITRQICQQCLGEWGGFATCPAIISLPHVDDCLGQLSHDLSSSVAWINGICYEYECKETVSGLSYWSGDWTARYTCSKGSVQEVVFCIVSTTFR